MPFSDPSLVKAVLETRRRVGRTTLVGISGLDCAGKSTLARRLAVDLRATGEDVDVVSGDDFNRPRAERSAYPAEEEDYGFAYEQLVRGLLLPARANVRVETRLRVKDWEHEAWGERAFVIESGAIVLVEGVFLFTPALLPLFDLTVWLEISFDEALARALERDADGMGGPNGVRERYATRYFPAQRVHLAHDRPQERAKIVMRS